MPLKPGNLVKCHHRPDLGVGCVVDVVSTGQAKVRWGEREMWHPVTELEHHLFQPGAVVWCKGFNRQAVVIGRSEISGYIYYEVRMNSGISQVPEDSLEPAEVLSPVTRLVTLDPRHWDHPEDVRLKTLALDLQYAHRYDPATCLSNCRLELMPHQVFVAHRVLSQPAPRWLLADEPGLGKTVEAGLVIKELRARGLAQRILIVAPAGLVAQWQWELENKFNEHFVIYDSLQIRYLLNEHGADKNPWLLHDRIITSLHLARDEEHARQIAECDWDLVVFDEAHHLRRHLDPTGPRTTKAYRLAEQVASRTYGLLLLTATPMQLNAYELFSLVQLLDPITFSDPAAFQKYLESIPNLNRRLAELERQGGDRAGAPVRREYEELSSRHLLTRVMVRNRKRAIGGFPEREARTLRVELTPEEQTVYEDIAEYVHNAYQYAENTKDWRLRFAMVGFQRLLTSSSYALLQSIRRRIAALCGELTPEEETVRGLEDLETVGDLDQIPAEWLRAQGQGNLSQELWQLNQFARRVEAIGVDSKLEKLARLLADILADPAEKVVIFTQFRDTAEYLARYLRQRYRVVTFHGGLSRQEKDRAVQEFRDEAQILVSTEAGGEGRNFQFCHIIINYDLPWNPMRVEQRIGRVDRIGQRRKVLIYNFAIAGTVEERIYEVLQERIGLFERSLGALDPILGELERDIERLIFHHRRNRNQDRIIERTLEERIRDVRAAEEQMEDFLLDRSSFRRDEASALLARKPRYTWEDLRNFVRSVLARYPGCRFEEKADGVDRVELSPGLLAELRRVVGDRALHPFYQGTFRVDVARRREEVEFFAFGHPLIDALVAYCASDHFPKAAGGQRVSHPAYRGTTGVLWTFAVDFTGIEGDGLVLPVFLDLHGAYDPERSQVLARIAGEPLDVVPPLDDQLLQSLQRKAEEIAHLQARSWLVDRKVREAQRYAAYRARIEHFRDARLHMLRQRVEERRQRVAAAEASAEPGQRRILPLLRHELDKAEDHLRQAEVWFRERLDELDRKRYVTFSVRLVSVLVVVVV